MIEQQGSPLIVTADNHILVLEEHERVFIRNLVHEIPPRAISDMNDDVFLSTLALTSRQMPPRLAEKLINFRKRSNMHGALLLRNFLLDDALPPSPSDGKSSLQKLTNISEYTLLAMMLWLGEPIAYADEKEGMLIQNICPVRGQEDRQENTGSVYLEFHTEDGFHPFKPDFVGLLCLRADHEKRAKIATASICHALAKLDATVIARLREPLYRIQVSTSFLKNSSEARYSHFMPILSGDDAEPEMCVDFHAMRALNTEAQQAMNALKQALISVLVEVALVPGDLILVDNRVAAHARTAFQPVYDGYDRWLQRLFVVQDYRRSRELRMHGGHVCAPIMTGEAE